MGLQWNNECVQECPKGTEPIQSKCEKCQAGTKYLKCGQQILKAGFIASSVEFNSFKITFDNKIG